MARTKNNTNNDARELARSLGELTYTGMDCKRNHGGIRYVSQGACVMCSKNHTKDFRDAHPDYHTYRCLTPEQVKKNKESQRRYVSRNKETIAAYQKEYHKTYTQK